MDVVYVLGTGSTWMDNELRYSLRSITSHLKGFGKVYLIGHRPPWIRDVCHIAMPDKFITKERNIATKVARACEIPELSERFLFMNDDHFLLKDCPVEVPNWHGGELKQYNPPKNNWHRAVHNTTALLKSMGASTWNFDIHTPIVLNKKVFPSIMASVDWDGTKHGFVMKSLYGNLMQLPGEYLPDLKLSAHYELRALVEILKPRTWFSIGPTILNDKVKSLFPALYPEASPFESGLYAVK